MTALPNPLDALPLPEHPHGDAQRAEMTVVAIDIRVTPDNARLAHRSRQRPPLEAIKTIAVKPGHLRPVAAVMARPPAKATRRSGR